MADGERERGVVRRLRGHKDSVSCCVGSLSSPHLLTSSSDDGNVCVFDLRSSTCAYRLQCFDGQPVVSVLPKPGSEDILYAAAGSTVYCLDFRQGPTGIPLQTYTFNREEINQVAVNPKCTFLAAADDSGETKIIDLRTHKLFKTLQGAHSNICSTVQFHARRPWEVLTGGLDSKIVKWDFNRGRPLQVTDLTSTAATSGEGVGRICNPPFVHALAVIEGEAPGEPGKLMAAARGDGAVDVFDSGLENFTSKSSSHPPFSKKKAPSSGTTEKGSHLDAMLPGRKRHLHSGIGGHTSIVNHVAFARFGDKGRFVVSGGNDTFIKLWDWAVQESTTPPSSPAAMSSRGPLVVNIKHKRKAIDTILNQKQIPAAFLVAWKCFPLVSNMAVNWLATTSAHSENLVVADTSKVLSVYSIL